MATEPLRPNGAGDECNISHETGCDSCSPNGAAGHYACVDEAVADDPTTVVYTQNAAYLRDLYNIADSGVGAGTINKITLYFRVGNTGEGNSVKGVIKSNSTVTETAEKDPGTDFGGGWGTYSQEWAKNPAPPGTDDWTWADIDALQAGVALKTPSLFVDVYCTQVYVVVDYTPAGWTGKISGVTNPAKIMGVDVANIAKVKGVA